ncbi:hypothetical protein GCM10009850_118490 [Nonomuraea monospora]|uniref:Uncharacterized protein n=1 Tax=Nonomuraea monospora TaxID=568818 RepID=A0ABP5PZ46_9ACTN
MQGGLSWTEPTPATAWVHISVRQTPSSRSGCWHSAAQSANELFSTLPCRVQASTTTPGIPAQVSQSVRRAAWRLAARESAKER